MDTQEQNQNPEPKKGIRIKLAMISEDAEALRAFLTTPMEDLPEGQRELRIILFEELKARSLTSRGEVIEINPEFAASEGGDEGSGEEGE